MLDEIHQKTGTGFDQGDAIRWNFGKLHGSEIGFLRCIDKSVRGKPTPYIKYERLVRFYNSKESGFNRKS